LRQKINKGNLKAAKPYFVKQCKDGNGCCYKYQVDLDMLWQGLNSLRDGTKGIHVSNACTCQFVWFVGIIKLLNKTFVQPTQEWTRG